MLYKLDSTAYACHSDQTQPCVKVQLGLVWTNMRIQWNPVYEAFQLFSVILVENKPIFW